jgi:AraC family transcriptional regulator, transcriptional activator of pobA
MPNKTKDIPLLSPSQLDKYHLRNDSSRSITHPLFKKLHFNKIEDYIKDIAFPLLPHRKTVFDFIFLTQGATVRSKGLDTYHIEESQIFFLPPLQITAHKSMDADTKGFYCHFDIDIFNNKMVKPDVLMEFPFLQFVGNPIVHIPQEAVAAIVAIFHRIEKEYLNQQADTLHLISLYLLTLFFEINRFAKPSEKTYENSAFRITQQYKNSLTQHIYTCQSVAAHADLLTISPNHLNKCIKASTGKSANELLEDMILLESKVLLKQTDLSISQIAYKVGKQTPTNFSRFFKIKMGVTPSEYRQIE